MRAAGLSRPGSHPDTPGPKFAGQESALVMSLQSRMQVITTHLGPSDWADSSLAAAYLWGRPVARLCARPGMVVAPAVRLSRAASPPVCPRASGSRVALSVCTHDGFDREPCRECGCDCDAKQPSELAISGGIRIRSDNPPERVPEGKSHERREAGNNRRIDQPPAHTRERGITGLPAPAPAGTVQPTA